MPELLTTNRSRNIFWVILAPRFQKIFHDQITPLYCVATALDSIEMLRRESSQERQKPRQWCRQETARPVVVVDADSGRPPSHPGQTQIRGAVGF